MATLEKSRKELAGEYERVQKKAFTNWVNSHLIHAGQKVDDLYEDLKDGNKLLLLLELLTEVKLPREKGKMRVHKLQNVQKALNFLQKERKIKLVNIRNDEVVDGNPKLILGLIWTLILHFQISGGLGFSDPGERPTSPQEISAKFIKEQLLEWAQKATEGYEEVKVTNFHTSWRDGMAFCAIIDRHRPDLFSYDDCDPDKPLENLEKAFSVAEKELGIFRIVDPEDVCVSKPDEKAVMTYVSFLHHAFPDMPPPHHKKAPTVSLDDYTQLHNSTKKWMDGTTQLAKDRAFPNSVDELKTRLAELEKIKSKEMPMKLRDVKTLSSLYDKLQAQKKKPVIPPELEFPPLAQAWAELQNEVDDCEKEMKDHLGRLEHLQTLADKILVQCDCHDSTLDQLEEKIASFEQRCTAMSPQEAASLAAEIKDEIEGLEEAVGELSPQVQQLRDGGYHNTDAVQNRVDEVAKRVEALSPRLEGASSAVSEAQAVVAMETSLEELEEWLVSCGKFSNNQLILVQIEEHKAFQLDQLSAAEERIAELNRSSPPAGLEGKVSEVNQRWKQVVKQTKDRIAGLEPIVETVRAFESAKNPLEDWCTQQKELFETLPPLEVAEEKLEEELRKMESVEAEVGAQTEAVERVGELSVKFIKDTEPVQSLADRYARRLKSRDTVPRSSRSRSSTAEPEASLGEQSSFLENQWGWVKAQASARSGLVADLLDKLRQFNNQYGDLRAFVTTGEELLASEHPVGDNAARIQEQMETCQEFRAKITSRQPDVDSMLALGRAILAEPNTSSQNDSLMQKLTDFIQDWSDLQMNWQNWYNELHANMEKSKNLSDTFNSFSAGLGKLESGFEKFFPATVSMEALDSQLQDLQTRFATEVVAPHEELKTSYQPLKAGAALLPDTEAGTAAFDKFEALSCSIEGFQQELSAVVGDVCGWWGGCEGLRQWAEEALRELADDKPLASNIDILENQKRKLQNLSEDISARQQEVEKALKSLSELASHDKLIDTAPVEDYRQQLKQQWDTLCQEVGERKELCGRGRDHLSSYADQSEPLSLWLRAAEERLQNLGPFPRSKEMLFEKKEELESFLQDVVSHGDDLESLEKKSSEFLSSAKAYQSQLLAHRSIFHPEDKDGLPEFFVDLESLEEGGVISDHHPDFHGGDYENAITVVSANSSDLRKRFDSLQAGVKQREQLLNQAVARRNEFDQSLAGLVDPLSELEARLAQSDRTEGTKLKDKMDNLQVLEEQCLALERKLQELNSSYDHLSDVSHSAEQSGAWEGGEGGEGGDEDDALREKQEAEKRYKDLLDRLHELKEQVHSEITNAEAFHDAFENFATWLRETERRMQRDDPLVLKEAELRAGLASLQAISEDITAHKGVYDAVSAKCCELIENGAEDSDELKLKLESLQQRWNAIQIVSDDIEAIEETIPKLEAFHKTYSGISSDLDDLLDRINGFSMSAITSEGLETKNGALKELLGEVAKSKEEFEDLLASCDLLETPFDQTHFQAEISALHDKLDHCKAAGSGKETQLKDLKEQVLPMEDLFARLRAWLSDSSTALEALSPPAEEEEQREEQLRKATALTEDVERHKEDFELLEEMVAAVLDLIDEDDCKDLKSQLREVTSDYDELQFDCNSYSSLRWLEDQATQLCSLSPCGVIVAPLQNQIHELQQFQKAVNSYQPQMDSLSALADQCDQSSTLADKPTNSRPKMTKLLQRYDKLKVLACERLEMLEGFMPPVQQFDSSRSTWGDLLCGWEDTAGSLPTPSGTPAAVQQQMEEMKSLQQSISDHEPEFTSLRRESQKLCEGPTQEKPLFEQLSQFQDQPASGEATVRPGQEEQTAILDDYERRLEALKRKLAEFSSVLAEQLGKAKDFETGLSDLLEWLGEVEAEMDELKIRDPKSSVIEAQQQKCDELLDMLASKATEKDNLANLFSELISNLSDDSPEKDSLQSSLDNLNANWSKVTDQLAKNQTDLQSALGLARSYEGALQKLVPWVPETLQRLENLGPPPTEPEMVEQLKTDIEGLKSAYNTLAPVYATSVDDSQALSACCMEGEPKAELDSKREELGKQWKQLGKLFADVILKLTDALAQTQEFQGIASGLDRWMSGMEEVLSKQQRVAARVRLIEPQIEGLQPTLADFTAYSSTVEQAKALGEKLMGESDAEERAKIETRLENLTGQFDKLKNSAQTRMSQLEDALAKATTYEGQSDQFDEWMKDSEEKLASLESFSIASQPLKRQLAEVQEFCQAVESHKPALDAVTSSEEVLFETELPTIELCEEHIQRDKQQSSSVETSGLDVLPDWFERPGASEAVEVGADLRNRFDELQLSVGSRRDEASQLLERVLSYEEDFDRFSDWLHGERAKIHSLAPPTITLSELHTQITKVESVQRDFKNEQEKLEAVDARGTALIDTCEDELSRDSGRIKLSDLNDLWGSSLAEIASREDKLREGIVLAEKYKGLHDGFDEWLCESEEKAGEPLLTTGDPLDIKKQLGELKVLLEDVSAHEADLQATTAAGHALEAYTDAEPSSLPDIGYTSLENRYNALKASVGDQITELEGTLGQVCNLHDQLNQLLEQLEKIKAQWEAHKPAHVLPDDVLAQLKELASVELSYTDLQPAVSKAKSDASVYTMAQEEPSPTTSPTGTPSGAEIQELLVAVEKCNGETKELGDYWRNLLNASLETAKKFDNDHSDLSDWLKEKEDELFSADTVRGVPEGVEEQIQQVEALQAEVPAHQKALDDLVALGHTMMDNCITEDSVKLGDKLARVQASFESLGRALLGRKRVLDDGLIQATDFLTAWTEALQCIAAKSSELRDLDAVGADIDTVKTQLDEYKEFETSLTELKPQISAVLAQGKQLKDNCSSVDSPTISHQLDQLNTAWSQLYSDGLGRKHQLEDALLQLGQFHDALAELLTWLADSMNTLRDAPPPGVKPESVELQMQELKNLVSSVSSHEPSVVSLNAAGEKLISCGSTENTAEIQQDLADLNSNWDSLKAMVADRQKLLEEALAQANSFQADWKAEVNWLAEAERQATAEWKPCGLPETCQAELYKHEAFQSSVDAHREPIEALKVQAETLKQYGTPEDCRMTDRWVGDVVKRCDDLQATLEEKQAQLEHAKKQADECEGLYHTLRDKLDRFDELQANQDPVHSEVEAVKQQMEEQKEHLKELSVLEGEVDELDGLSQLLCRDCVKPDSKIVQQRTEELRTRLEGLQSSAEERQSLLEESLLSLGQFEEAYDELWAWLTDAVKQLEDADPITGDPDTVAVQLTRHKALQKQLGSRHSSKNAVTKAGKVLMKHKTGEDKAVLKKKLQDVEREWEKVCELSVEKQDKLEDAYRKIAQFRSHLGPLRSWMAKVLPLLDESEPVHGDISTVDALCAAHNAFQKELGAHQKGMDAANTSGEQLVSEILDDPSVTQQDLAELNELWETVCQQSVKKQERLDQAMEAAKEFDEGLSGLVLWIDATTAELSSQPPPNEDASILQQQIEEHKALSQEVTAKQPDLDKVLAAGENLLQLAHPRAVPILQSKLQQLNKKWLDLRGRTGARSEELASALLELHGLQDMLDKLWGWVSNAEDTMATTEATPIGNDLESVEEQLTAHEVFQEEMATHQPNMDALNKAAKKRKAAHSHANPEMTKKIGSLYKRWQKLWYRSSERHRQLLEARTRLKDIALARSFNFDAWRKRFKGWVDQQKLRVNDLFRRFDGNHDGMLTREEFMKGLKASGLAMTQIELEKIANAFDRDRDGLIDLNEIMAVLKGSRRTQAVRQEAISDSDKIENEIQLQVSKCTCASKFKVTRVAEGQYRFGDVQKLRLVRILRSTVMVRVGGGWEPLEEFLRKHDPCRASGRTNVELNRYLGSNAKPGLATAEFTSKRQTATAAKNAALKKAANEDPLSELTTRTLPSGRKETTVTKRLSPANSSRESTPPTRESTQKSPVHHAGVATSKSPVRHAHTAGDTGRTSRSTPPRSLHQPSASRSTPPRSLQPSSSARSTPQRLGTKAAAAGTSRSTAQQRGTTPPRANGATKTGRSQREGTPQKPSSTASRRPVTPEAKLGQKKAQSQASSSTHTTPTRRPAAAQTGSTSSTSTAGQATPKRPTATGSSGSSGQSGSTRPTTPGGGVPRVSRIPTPAKSKIPKRQS